MEIFAETNRLILREFLPTDDAFILEMDSNEEVHRYLGNNPISTIETARNVVNFIRKQYVDLGIGRWVVVEKASQQPIGWSGLKLMKEPVNNHVDFYDLGYRYIPKYWGKGYASEAALASIDYGFNTLKTDAIYAIVDEQNVGSNNVLHKVGFTYVESFMYNDVPHGWFELHSQK